MAAALSYGARSRLSDMMALQKSRASLKALFEDLDVDGSGEVDKKEWGKAVRAHAGTMAKFFGGAAASEHTLKSIGEAFNKIDKDKSGTLTWTEFEQFANVR